VVPRAGSRADRERSGSVPRDQGARSQRHGAAFTTVQEEYARRRRSRGGGSAWNHGEHPALGAEVVMDDLAGKQTVPYLRSSRSCTARSKPEPPRAGRALSMVVAGWGSRRTRATRRDLEPPLLHRRRTQALVVQLGDPVRVVRERTVLEDPVHPAGDVLRPPLARLRRRQRNSSPSTNGSSWSATTRAGYRRPAAVLPHGARRRGAQSRLDTSSTRTCETLGRHDARDRQRQARS
jgi:hypothetical protein